MSKSLNNQILYFPDRITNAMKRITDYPLTIVEAPMGYGKSSAVWNALKESDAQTIWITIEEEMVGSFWGEICNGLETVNKEVAVALSEIGFPKNQQARQEALVLIQRAKLESRTVIVLDGYHLIGGDTLNKLIQLMAVKEIRNLHIVLLTRYIDMKNTDELTMKGYLYYLKKKIFELTPQEIKKYYNLCGVNLNETETHKLLKMTEGWYMGLNILLSKYKKQELQEPQVDVESLIENTIMAAYSNEMKVLLESVCFLHEFDKEQAILMSGNENAVQLLEEIILKNGFMNYDKKTQKYQLHHIVSKYLQQNFNQRELVYRIPFYQRIAQYHFKKGNYTEAMSYFYLMGNFEQLFAAVEGDRGHSIHNYNQEIFIGYFEEASKEVRLKHPIAMLIYAICLFSFNEMERFATVCIEFEEALEVDQALDQESLAELRGEYEILLTFTKYNDIKKMLEHIKKAERLLTRPVRFLDTQSSWTFNSPSILYMFYRETGTLLEEVENLKEAMPVYRKLTDGHGAGSEAVMEAEYYYSHGDFESAEILLNKALYPANRNGQNDIVICALFLNVKIAISKGHFDVAFDNIQKMYEKVNTEKWSGLYQTIDLCQGWLYASLGQYDKMPSWISEGDLDASKLYFPTQPYYKMIYGKALLIHGEYLKILGISEELIEESSFYPNILSLIYIHIYIAAANYQIHRVNDGKFAVKKALDFAMADRVYMPFVENYEYIKPLLEEVMVEGLYQQEIQTILKIAKPYRGSIDHIKSQYFANSKPVLTDREKEIAMLASTGMTNKEIGIQLFISTNTVKMALKSIFTKLSINNRALLKQYFS